MSCRFIFVISIVSLTTCTCSHGPTESQTDLSNDLAKTKIAYTSFRGTIPADLYTMDIDGFNDTKFPTGGEFARWSADGTKIAIQQTGITIRNFPSGDEISFYDIIVNSYDWSPDGLKFAYSRENIIIPHDIFVSNIDGSNEVNLTNDDFSNMDPRWSPDGTKIAFRSFRDDNNGEIYIMNSDGSDVNRLTNNNTGDLIGDFSPDGTKILFSRQEIPPLFQIYVMNVDGSNQLNLSNNPSINDWQPTWAPDGTKIAFSRTISGTNAIEIFIMDSDGSNQTRITDGNFRNSVPAWSPVLNNSLLNK